MKCAFTYRYAALLISFLGFATLLAPACLASPQPVTVPVERADEILISYPKPKYPRAARLHHMTGMGIFEVHVQLATGDVTNVSIVRSTGFPILDQSATDALKRWQFRPNKVTKIRLPITFRM
jgi:protein TonB